MSSSALETVVGPEGPIGPVGPTGPQGDPGNNGGGTYVHDQSAPATVWTIAHGLGMFPNVTTVDSILREFDAEIDYVDNNNLTVTVAIATAGFAYLS